MVSENEDKLDNSFITGIKEELAAIEENEKNIQALSQVFRYYAKYAKQLAQVLYDFTTQQCFPWEIIHALNLADDILLMDKTGRYKVELTDMVQGLVVTAFKKVPSNQERREVARMFHAWKELGVFDAKVLEAVRIAIREQHSSHGEILDEASAADEEDDNIVPEPESLLQSHPSLDCDSFVAETKRRRVGYTECMSSQPSTIGNTGKSDVSLGVSTREAAQTKSLTVLERILSLSLDRPFEILGISENGVQGHDIRKAYRRIALLIHPDKNPGLEVKCQEALIKLQQGRELAENDLQRFDLKSNSGTRTDTRSAATQANNAAETTFKCKHPGCDLAPCKQCANGCCTRNITHCHMIARSKGGLQCYFHPPPRAWARNA